MAEFSKFTMVAATRVLTHNNREETLDVEQQQALGLKRENIDSSRTALNYNLAEQDRKMIINANGAERCETTLEKYSRKMEEIQKEYENKTTTYTRKNRKTGKQETITKKRSIQKNADSLCSWVITAPKDLPSEEQADFFKNSYDFVAKKYGRDNIVSADVHNDEAQPHIHISFIPIVADKKNGGNKLCANNLETPKTLSKFHQNLSKELEAKMGHKVNVLNGATVGGNQSITQLKTQTALKELAEITLQIADKKSEKDLQDVLEKICEPLANLEQAIEKRGFFKGRPKEQFESVVAVAEEAKTALQTIVDCKSSITSKSDEVNKKIDEIFEQVQATYKQSEKELKSFYKKNKLKEQELNKREKNIDTEVNNKLSAEIANLQKQKAEIEKDRVETDKMLADIITRENSLTVREKSFDVELERRATQIADNKLATSMKYQSFRENKTASERWKQLHKQFEERGNKNDNKDFTAEQGYKPTANKTQKFKSNYTR